MRRPLSIIAVLGAGVLLLAGTACRDQQAQQRQEQGQQPGAGGAGEQDEMKQDQQAQKQEQKEETITGRVASVDGNSIKVLDTRRNEVVELEVPDDAQVMRQGQRISLDDISEGAEVRASYTMDQDEKVVRSLTVTSEPQQQQEQPS
ncbi:MAG: hypothetical protein ACOX6T_18995 [Myxococcales bacterium]|jgi:Cu/Ag efflux protein CusF